MPETETRTAHLSFLIGTEEYALPLERIWKAVGVERLTRVPTAPPFVKGLLAIDGLAVPVVDLAAKFGAARVGAAERSSVLAVDIAIGGRPRHVGILVDRLGRVLRVPAGRLQPPQALEAVVPAEFIVGMLEQEGRFAFFLDLDRVLDGDESARLEELTAQERAAGSEGRRQQPLPFLTVRLAEERCALRLSDLREALPASRITRIAGTPPHVLGAANVRGAIVAVIDAARRYGLGATRELAESRLIVVRTASEQNDSPVGFMVDAIERLVQVAPEEIDRTPPFGTRFPAELVQGMVPLGGEFVPILDSARIVGAAPPTIEPGPATGTPEKRPHVEHESA